MAVKHGPGLCRICGRESGFSVYDVQQIDRRLKDEPVTKVAASIGVHPSSVRRHLANHTGRPQIVRDVRLDEDRSSLDLVDELVQMYDDANRIRIESMSRGDFAVSLRASTTASRIAAQLHEQLGVTAATHGQFVKDTDAMVRALQRLFRKHPLVARSMAAESDDERLRDDLHAIYEMASADKHEPEREKEKQVA